MAERTQARTISPSSKRITRSQTKGQTSNAASNMNSLSYIQASTSEPQPQSLFLDNLPNEVLDNILSKFETHEQFQLRGVCHKWKNLIEQIFAITRCLKLCFKRSTDLFLGRQFSSVRYGNGFLTTNPTRCKIPNNRWSPEVSQQSEQFDSNWTESLKLTKTATVAENVFNENCVNVFVRLFSRVPHLVIYFDLNEKRRNFDNLITMIEGFKMLESFSIIRSKSMFNYHFSPNLCETLEGLSSLRRLGLYVDHKVKKVPPNVLMVFALMPMAESIGRLEHFALSSWPLAVMDHDRTTLMQNIGATLKNERQNTNEPHQLVSLCISPYSSAYELMNMNQAFVSNPKLKNVKRLQLTQLKMINHVRQCIEHFSKLESLEMRFSFIDNIKPNYFAEMLNQCKHLTEVKIFNGCLAPYEAGPFQQSALNICKLTIRMCDLFENFKRLIEQRDLRAPRRGPCYTKVTQEFVKLIELKFPSLEELTVLTSSSIPVSSEKHKNFTKLQKMIIGKFRENDTNLNLKIDIRHVECSLLFH